MSLASSRARRRTVLVHRRVGARAVAFAWAVALAMVSGLPAEAQEGAGPEDEATRRAARQLAQEGLELLRKGKYTEAQDRLHRAYEIVPAPTVLLLEARALEGMGKLVEAAEAYEKVRQTKLTDDSPEPYAKAVEEATADGERIGPLIPQITVVLEGIGHQTPGFEIRVDGVLLPKALLGAKLPANPGKHDVVAILDGKVVDRHDLELKPGQHERVLVKVKTDEEGKAQPLPTAEGDTEGEFPYRTVGFISLGVGGAGLAAGAVFLGIQLSKKSTLDDHCQLESGGERVCPPEYEDDLSAYNTARSVSTVGFVLGALGVAGGVTLLYLAPPEDRPDSGASVSAWLGPGQVGISGTF